MDLKSIIPWQLKILLKIVLSRMPRGYQYWQRNGLFRHGNMDKPEYAFKVFKEHYDRVDFARKGKGFVTLELGPGDSLFSAILTKAFGGSATYLIDSGPFAQCDFKYYKGMINYLICRGYSVPKIGDANCLNDLLTSYNAYYGSNGLESLKTITDESIDFVWSHAVLEHIKLTDFMETMKQLRRVLRPDGVCSHRIDLKDHLGGSLNNLLFSENIWESNFMSRSGFYTNRIRFTEMMDLFLQTGFDIHSVNKVMWLELPVSQHKLAKQFKSLDDEELRISAFDVVLTPRSH